MANDAINYGAKRIVSGAGYGMRDWLSQRVTRPLPTPLGPSTVMTGAGGCWGFSDGMINSGGGQRGKPRKVIREGLGDAGRIVDEPWR